MLLLCNLYYTSQKNTYFYVDVSQHEIQHTFTSEIAYVLTHLCVLLCYNLLLLGAISEEQQSLLLGAVSEEQQVGTDIIGLAETHYWTVLLSCHMKHDTQVAGTLSVCMAYFDQDS